MNKKIAFQADGMKSKMEQNRKKVEEQNMKLGKKKSAVKRGEFLLFLPEPTS